MLAVGGTVVLMKPPLNPIADPYDKGCQLTTVPPTAQVHTAAWSGLGMVRNCCGGNTTMPSIFSRTLATVNTDGSWWANAASAAWTADALVINLGTNDGSAATDPEYTYVKTYAEVVMNASKHYGPVRTKALSCCCASTVFLSQAVPFLAVCLSGSPGARRVPSLRPDVDQLLRAGPKDHLAGHGRGRQGP
eukprot:SAG22_NODE_2482_length_2526_cov_1.823651_2_plen_191_part_00